MFSLCITTKVHLKKLTKWDTGNKMELQSPLQEATADKTSDSELLWMHTCIADLPRAAIINDDLYIFRRKIETKLNPKAQSLVRSGLDVWRCAIVHLSALLKNPVLATSRERILTAWFYPGRNFYIPINLTKSECVSNF